MSRDPKWENHPPTPAAPLPKKGGGGLDQLAKLPQPREFLKEIFAFFFFVLLRETVVKRRGKFRGDVKSNRHGNFNNVALP